MRNVEKRYPQGTGWLTVLREVSLSVARGEFVAVVGPSGAGKSTLLHLIGGLDLPTSGDVLVEGQSWPGLSERQQARRRNEVIGFVFQFYHLLPELTVLENTMLPALLSGRTSARWLRQAEAAPLASARERALVLLDRVGLRSRLTHRPAELSGGEQQRVAIARALINEPQLLLCDEPTGNLDSETGAAVLELILDGHRRLGMTVILVTHEQALAKAAGRVVAMRDGRL